MRVVPGVPRPRSICPAALLLSFTTRRIVVAPGIASIYARDAMAIAARQRTLCGAFPGRFLLGLGVSHRPLVEGVRGTPTVRRSPRCAPTWTRWTRRPTRRRARPPGRVFSPRSARGCSRFRATAPLARTPYFVPSSTPAGHASSSAPDRYSPSSRRSCWSATRIGRVRSPAATRRPISDWTTTPTICAVLATPTTSWPMAAATASWMRSSPVAAWMSLPRGGPTWTPVQLRRQLRRA